LTDSRGGDKMAKKILVVEDNEKNMILMRDLS